MYYLREKILDPLTAEYNRYIDGYYLSDLLQIKGGQTAGNDYISKVFRSQYHEIQQKYDTAVESIRNPTFNTFLQDNFFRLFGLNAIQRLITAYQAYPILKAKYSFPGTLSHTFTEITNEGLFSGLLKGSLLAAAQFGLVLYPSVYIANKSENKYTSFLASYTIFDTLLFPLDIVKNILYSETHSNLKLRNIFEYLSVSSLYKGLGFKLAFNVPYLTSLYLTAQSNSEPTIMLSWLLTAALYPLNTLKVRSQLMSTKFSIGKDATNPVRSGFYRGVVPFLLINGLFGWTLRPLFSQDKLSAIHDSVQEEKMQILHKL